MLEYVWLTHSHMSVCAASMKCRWIATQIVAILTMYALLLTILVHTNTHTHTLAHTKTLKDEFCELSGKQRQGGS